MPQMTGTILYVNAPKDGQRSGSIKFDTNERVGVLPNQLGLFRIGQQVSIEYKDRQGRDGKWWKDFVSFTGQEGTGNGYAPPAPPPAYRPQPPQTDNRGHISRPAAPRPPAPQAPRQQQGHDYNTGKQIAVTGITQRAVQAGLAITEISACMRLVASVYDDIFKYGDQERPQPQRPAAPIYDAAAPVYDRGQPAGPRDDVPFNDSVDDLGMEEPPY